jgi:aspartyl/asparaginyl beta-hydroxylase (cupin superfamily)/Tfp pilus assembly protein PilF
VSRVSELVQLAESFARAGQTEDAYRAWQKVLSTEPDNPRALFAMGGRALRLGDAATARAYLANAARSAPNEPGIQVNLAIVCRMLGDTDGELRALDRAIEIEETLQVLLLKAAFQERTGQIKAAGRTYRRALAVAPPLRDLNDEAALALARGRELVESQADELEAYLKERLSALRMRNSWLPLDRFDEALGIAAGKKKIYTQKPAQLFYPGLPAIQYYDDSQFPWLRHLEAAAPQIRDELVGLVAEEMDDFAPYVLKPENVPVQQWGELNRSTKWSAYFLWQDGARVAEHCERCPVTATALEHSPMAKMPGYAPTAFFSSLEPRVRIPPHTGSTNVRLIVHLPLIVPKGCFFRVGNETREWTFGKAWVFDDSIEHEAWNDSDEQRVILIFDVWNPHLSEAERELVCEMQKSLGEFYKSA